MERILPAPRRIILAVLLLSLSVSGGGCGTETQPRLGDAGLRPAEISSRSSLRPGSTGAVLVATGRQSFEGTLPGRCAVHDGTGLQVSLRTGDPDLPVVSLRIVDYQGGGPYRGQLFVTGRSRMGALAGSTGEASLELREPEAAPASSSGLVVLQGSFEGTYQGQAGKGSVQGRFQGCTVPLGRKEASGPDSSLAR